MLLLGQANELLRERRRLRRQSAQCRLAHRRSIHRSNDSNRQNLCSAPTEAPPYGGTEYLRKFRLRGQSENIALCGARIYPFPRLAATSRNDPFRPVATLGFWRVQMTSSSPIGHFLPTLRVVRPLHCAMLLRNIALVARCCAAVRLAVVLDLGGYRENNILAKLALAEICVSLFAVFRWRRTWE